MILGKNLSSLHQEAGGLRMQRVPPTEKRGRVHTSTVTVAIMDHAPATVKSLDMKDIRVEWFSGTGKGGQHRNKHANSCRLIHIPTGIVTTSQTRSRVNSYENALTSLKQQLQEQTRSHTHQLHNCNRQNQIGSGERGDKIRTIRFQDDQVLDHRTNKSISAEKFMQGHMYLLWSQPVIVNNPCR